jgi:hypothetical protein
MAVLELVQPELASCDRDVAAAVYASGLALACAIGLIRRATAEICRSLFRRGPQRQDIVE